MIEHITKKEFDEKVKNGKEKALVDFFATWCGPCKMLAPELEKLDQKNIGVKIYKVDVDENMELSMEYKIEVVPTMLYFVDGELKAKFTGLMTAEELAEKLK